MTDAEIQVAATAEAQRFAVLLTQYRDACFIAAGHAARHDAVRAKAAGLLLQRAQDALQEMHAETVVSALRALARAPTEAP